MERSWSGKVVAAQVACGLASGFLFCGVTLADGVLSVTPVGSRSYIAVGIELPEGLSLAGLDFLNNDGGMAFPQVILMEKAGADAPDLANSALILAEISGPSLAWGVVDLETAVSSSTGEAYAVFMLPEQAELNGLGQGMGPGIGVGLAAVGTTVQPIYLSSDGVRWTRYDPSMELKVVPRYASGKQAAGISLAELRDQRQASGVPASSGSGEQPIVPAYLRSVRPNPFNPRALIEFELADAGQVELAVFDLRGRRVRSVAQGPLAAGRHERMWMGDDDGGIAVASGTYLLLLEAGGIQDSRKLMLVR